MRPTAIISAAVFAIAVAASSASAQDFQQTYNLSQRGSINIATMSGDVKVTGYGGSTVVVTAVKRGTNVDVVAIEDRSSDGRIDIGVRYPKNSSNNVSVDFEVMVPANIDYNFDKITSMSGDVEITGVSGRINAKSMSGDVRVRGVSGTVEATAMSGDVYATIDRLEGDGDLSFTTMSGDVEVRLPGYADAMVSMQTMSGSLSTDFPLQIEKQQHGPGATAKGQINGGSRTLRIKSLSGNARLIQN